MLEKINLLLIIQKRKKGKQVKFVNPFPKGSKQSKINTNNVLKSPLQFYLG
jgi:hypothetical protein